MAYTQDIYDAAYSVLGLSKSQVDAMSTSDFDTLLVYASDPVESMKVWIGKHWINYGPAVIEQFFNYSKRALDTASATLYNQARNDSSIDYDHAILYVVKEVLGNRLPSSIYTPTGGDYAYWYYQIDSGRAGITVSPTHMSSAVIALERLVLVYYSPEPEPEPEPDPEPEPEPEPEPDPEPDPEPGDDKSEIRPLDGYDITDVDHLRGWLFSQAIGTNLRDLAHYMFDHGVTEELAFEATDEHWMVAEVYAERNADPGEGGTDPGEGGTDPGEGGTDPGDGGTDPGDGGTDPGDGGTDPGDGGTDPGEGPGIDPESYFACVLSTCTEFVEIIDAFHAGDYDAVDAYLGTSDWRQILD